MAAWIKNNLVLVSGIVLPVLLVAGFFVLSQAPRMLTDPPQYDFVLIAYRYDHPLTYTLAFEVREGRLYGKAIPHVDPGTYTNRQRADIFRYRAAEGSFEEIVYERPEGLDDVEETTTFPITEVSELNLDKRSRSPDGYTFEQLANGGRGGLLGELFGMGRHYESNYVLRKNGAQVNLPRPAESRQHYGHELHFIGWIIEDEPRP